MQSPPPPLSYFLEHADELLGSNSSPQWTASFDSTASPSNPHHVSISPFDLSYQPFHPAMSLDVFNLSNSWLADQKERNEGEEPCSFFSTRPTNPSTPRKFRLLGSTALGSREDTNMTFLHGSLLFSQQFPFLQRFRPFLFHLSSPTPFSTSTSFLHPPTRTFPPYPRPDVSLLDPSNPSTSLGPSNRQRPKPTRRLFQIGVSLP